uniref:Peroxidase 2 n=2 Tax=Aegilops tauschii TaxID=37682 RepID=N1R181_AEGTA
MWPPGATRRRPHGVGRRSRGREVPSRRARCIDQNLPAPFLGVAGLNASFVGKGFNLTDMVALSGGHTIGMAQCQNFRGRLYNESNINTTYATKLKLNCPQSGGNTNLAPLDDDTTIPPNPDLFNNDYFINLQSEKGLLHSEQVLYNATAAAGATEDIVKAFASSQAAFFSAFASAMAKMANLSPLTGSQGQVRSVCSIPN